MPWYQQYICLLNVPSQYKSCALGLTYQNLGWDGVATFNLHGVVTCIANALELCFSCTEPSIYPCIRCFSYQWSSTKTAFGSLNHATKEIQQCHVMRWCPGSQQAHFFAHLYYIYNAVSTLLLYSYISIASLVCSMMTSSNGNIFRATGHLCGEFTGLRWIPHTKASDAELWYFLWSASE